MKKRLITRYVFLALSLAVMAVIFYFSSQDGERSSAQSGWFSKIVKSIFNAFNAPDAAESILPFIRKIAHYTLYALLGLCVSVFAFTFNFRKKWLWIVIPLVVCLIYACSDEFHQLFVEGRDGKFLDVLVDGIGFASTILFSNLIWFLILRRKSKKSLKTESYN